MIVKNEIKNKITYDFILCMRADTLICKNLNFKKLHKDEIYLEKKINNIKKIIVDFKKNFDHKSFIVILNTKNIKKFNYGDIFSFSINKKENYFNQFRPAVAFQSFQKPIFLTNKVNTSLPMGYSEIIRRKYFEKEYFYSDNKLIDAKELGDDFLKNKQVIKYNNFVYDNFYKPGGKFKLTSYLRNLPINIKIKSYYLTIYMKWILNNVKSRFN